MDRWDVAVVGAGIVGLAHAWSAAERGHRVTLFERTRKAQAASVRNFGMIWPIGQPAGELYDTALLSRQRWLQLAESTGIWLNPCGSIHLAHRPDELAVIEQFAELANADGVECQLLTAAETAERSPAARRSKLLGGLLSPTELAVNPRTVIGQIPPWLHEQFNVQLRFETAVTSVEPTATGSSNAQLRTSADTLERFDRVIVCGGVEVGQLFPAAIAASGLKLCKLQMMRTVTQPDGWSLGPHVASGLTLRHYAGFERCSMLSDLRRRIASETPELDQYGIHVMASQNDAGHIILGDSHEYDEAIEPFDRTLIDELMLRELKAIMDLPDWTIEQRWHGLYAKHPQLPIWKSEPFQGVHLRTGTGGAGMTMSFGLAELDWRKWSGEVPRG